MSKMTAVLTLGVGYVLGSRAGRQRYEQLKRSATKVAQRPEVQQARDRAKTAVSEKFQKGTGPGKQFAATAKQRAADVSAKLRPNAASTIPLTQTATDPYADLATGIPAASPPPQAGPASDPLTTPDLIADPSIDKLGPNREHPHEPPAPQPS